MVVLKRRPWSEVEPEAYASGVLDERERICGKLEEWSLREVKAGRVPLSTCDLLEITRRIRAGKH